MAESNLTLASIAILRVDLDTQSRDYLDYLSPFVLGALQGQDKTAVSDAQIRDEVLVRFGLMIPAPVIQLVLKRFTRQGYLTRASGVFHISRQLPSSDVEQQREQARGKIASVVAGLVAFAKEKYDLTIPESDASDALLALLRTFGVDYLAAFDQQTAIPEVGASAESLEFVTCAYIAELHRRNDANFQELMVMLKGVLLSNALLCPDLDSIKKNFKGTVFYLDSPILISLLGLHGQRDFVLAKEMVELLRNLKGTLAFFDHSLEETTNVIQSAIDNYDHSAFRMRVVDECRREGKKKSDLVLLHGKVEEALGELGLGLERRITPRDLADFQVIDETQLESAVKDEIEYMNPRAMHYDLHSIRSIYALRKGRRPRRLEDCPSVLVTNNGALARAASGYGRQHEASSEVSPAITDFSLSNVAWLKAPMGAPQLPETELLALCYAGLEPGDALWSAYVKEINGLREKGSLSADDHAILRSSELARTELANLTLGSEQAFGAETITEVLERVKNSLVSEESSKLDQEKEEHDSTRKAKEALEAKQAKVKESLFWRARGDSELISVGIFWGTILVFAVASYLTAPFGAVVQQWLKKDYGAISRIAQAAAMSAIGFLAVFGILNLGWGLSVKDVCGNLQRRLEKWLYRRRYKAIYGEDPEESSYE